MLNIQTQHKFKYAHQQILFLNFFSMLNSFINTAHRALALAIGHFFFSGGAEEGALWGHAVHGIKKCLAGRGTRLYVLYISRY